MTGPGLPTGSLGDPAIAMVDLRGNGLSDIVELGASPRYWSNRSNRRFDLPRSMAEAPPHRLGDPGVHFIDADGNSRADLVVTAGVQARNFPLIFSGGRTRRSSSRTGRSPASGSTIQGPRPSTSTGTG